MRYISLRAGTARRWDPLSIMVIHGGARLRLQQMFLRYSNVMRRSPPATWDDTLAVEVFHRLERPEWLEWEVRTRDLEIRNPRLANERLAQLMIEIPTLVETWYYLAFRTMRLIKLKCPELGCLEIRGITLTRNQLIEHPNGIYSANIALDGDNGPQVKGPRWDGQSEEWADPGMFANAAELDAGLRELLGPFVLRDITESSQ
jgi:hypothetical protein